MRFNLAAALVCGIVGGAFLGVGPAHAEIIRRETTGWSTTSGSQVTNIDVTKTGSYFFGQSVKDYTLFIQGEPCGCSGDTAIEESMIDQYTTESGTVTSVINTLVDLNLNAGENYFELELTTGAVRK